MTSLLFSSGFSNTEGLISASHAQQAPASPPGEEEEDVKEEDEKEGQGGEETEDTKEEEEKEEDDGGDGEEGEPDQADEEEAKGDEEAEGGDEEAKDGEEGQCIDFMFCNFLIQNKLLKPGLHNIINSSFIDTGDEEEQKEKMTDAAKDDKEKEDTGKGEESEVKEEGLQP